jgi:hypothetical protein
MLLEKFKAYFNAWPGRPQWEDLDMELKQRIAAAFNQMLDEMERGPAAGAEGRR